MDDSIDKHEKRDDPAITAERPERTNADEATDDPATSKALGPITLVGGASPYAGVIATPDEKLDEEPPPESRDSSDPRGY